LTDGSYRRDMNAQRAVAVRTEYYARPGRRAIVVSDFASLRGPSRGTVELPLRLYWSGPSPVFDLEDPDMRRWLYQIVLREASRPQDLTGYLDRDTLIGVWPELHLPKACGRYGKSTTRSCAPRHLGRPGAVSDLHWQIVALPLAAAGDLADDGLAVAVVIGRRTCPCCGSERPDPGDDRPAVVDRPAAVAQEVRGRLHPPRTGMPPGRLRAVDRAGRGQP
jgi:hypothetical protein